MGTQKTSASIMNEKHATWNNWTKLTPWNRVSSEADSNLAGQEILCLLQNPKVNYHVHNILPMATILGHMYPHHTLRSYCFNIIPFKQPLLPRFS